MARLGGFKLFEVWSDTAQGYRSDEQLRESLLQTSYTCRVLSQARTWVGPLALAAAFLLPILATVALYLPGGLLMPARLVTLLLAGIAVVQFLFHREPLPKGVCIPVGTVCDEIGRAHV